MKLTSILITTCALFLVSNTAMANPATSQKHANKANKVRHAVFTMLGANMGTLGGMAKGKVPFNVKTVEKNAERIHQLSLMISDYTSTDTRSFKVKTKALPEVWTKRQAFEKRVDDLTLASANLVKLVNSGDEAKILSGIKSVGKTCGGCHDNFKFKK